jgi:Ser/Thr protein kinase RdoA (MazF antagonist)
MDRQEALALLNEHLDLAERVGYAALAARAGQEDHLQLRAASGADYQLELSFLWEAGPGGPVRILGSIDDGGLRAFVPLSSSRLVPGPEQAGAVLGPLLARGRTADLHAWESGWVLKLYHEWFGPEEIQFEARIAQAVHASGLPVPAPGAILRVGGRNGLLYERVDGVEMWRLLARRPWQAGRFARRMAALHAEMHSRPFGSELPAQRLRLVRKIEAARSLSQALRARALAILETLPDGDRLCHGDFHPGNILVGNQGEVIIDWIDANRGSPLADVARTAIIALGEAAVRQSKDPLVAVLLRRFLAAYLKEYFQLHPGGESEYRRWLPVVAAARLSEDISELEAWLLLQVEQGSRHESSGA